MARQSDHLAEEMSRFEQEILGDSGVTTGSAPHHARPPPQPLLSQHVPPQVTPPGPPPGMPPGLPPGMPPGPSRTILHGPPRGMPSGPPQSMPSGPPRGMPSGPPQSMPPGPPRGMPSGPHQSMPPGPPRGMPPGPPQMMLPGPPRTMPPGPPGGLPPGIRPLGGGAPQPSFNNQPQLNSLPPRPLLDTPHSRLPLGGPPLRPPGPSGPPGPPRPPPSGMQPVPSFRPLPPPSSSQAPMGGPPSDSQLQPAVAGVVLHQAPMPLLPQPPPAAPVAGHPSNTSVVSSMPKPASLSMIPPMVPTAVPPRQAAIASMAIQPPSNDFGATGGPATTKIFPGRTRPLKTKRDPKKLRLAGGQVWEDHSLDDWDPNDFRIFCGDIGNDVNDDTLARAFSKYPTFLKAKVIRDKFTKKTKGFGFVSFKDPHDFMQAMREMNGKYIGNRPVKLRKSTWRERCFEVVKKRDKEKKKLGFK